MLFFWFFYRFNQDFVQVCGNVKKLLFKNLKRLEIIHRRSTRETSTGSTKAETAHSRLKDIAHVHAHLKILCLDCLRGSTYEHRLSRLRLHIRQSKGLTHVGAPRDASPLAPNTDAVELPPASCVPAAQLRRHTAMYRPYKAIR